MGGSKPGKKMINWTKTSQRRFLKALAAVLYKHEHYNMDEMWMTCKKLLPELTSSYFGAELDMRYYIKDIQMDEGIKLTRDILHQRGEKPNLKGEQYRKEWEAIQVEASWIEQRLYPNLPKELSQKHIKFIIELHDAAGGDSDNVLLEEEPEEDEEAQP